MMKFFVSYSPEIFILGYLIVTFLQPGIDKITDWKGNISFITQHFEASPLKNSVPFLLSVILILELIASVIMVIGIYQILAENNQIIALYGTILTAITLLFLLIGQRLAKDYAGAMSLTVYFILTVFGMFLLGF